MGISSDSTFAPLFLFCSSKHEELSMPDSEPPTEAEIDAVIEEFGGDLREAIRALLSDLAILAADFAGSVSRGYMRCGLPEGGPVRRSAGKLTRT